MSKVEINITLVRELVASQFPQWADLEVRPVEIDGHDNRTFHLGDAMSVRMPSHKRYAAHAVSEQTWLPKLAKHLPLPIPDPIGIGKPSPIYPWPWTINRWVPGDNASIDNISNMNEFAEDLAGFLNSLRSIDASNAPSPSPDNFYRGGSLSMYDSETRECIEALSDIIDRSTAEAVWETALMSSWDHPPVWIHGDVAIGNLLVRNGKLSAVIDFGQLAAGDPACDTTIAWTFFSGSSRKIFQRKLNIDNDTLARGRGWGLWKALLMLRGYRDKNSQEAKITNNVICDILAEHVSLMKKGVGSNLDL